MDPIVVVGNIALVCTIASNFSGLPICIDFLRKGSTADASLIPFLAGVTCISLWLMYSIILGDGMMQTVNVIAVFLQTCYVLCYYCITRAKQKAGQLIFAVIVFLFAVYAFNFHIANEGTARLAAGYLASLGSISACASPLVTVAEVFRTQSSESLPFLMIFSSFIVSSLWYCYGILVANSFIQVPNLIGAILSGCQLGLIVMYPGKRARKESKME